MVEWDYFKQFGSDIIAAAILTEQTPTNFKWPDWELVLFNLLTQIHLMSEVKSDREKVLCDLMPMRFMELPGQTYIDWMVAKNTRIPASIANAVLFDQTAQDYRPNVSKVSFLSLVISGGTENKLLPTEVIRFVHDNLSGSQFSLYEDSSHCPFQEETESFNQEADEFVRSLA